MGVDIQIAMYLAAIMYGWLIPEFLVILANRPKDIPTPINILNIIGCVSITYAYIN